MKYIQDYFMAHLFADSFGNTVKLYRRRESVEKGRGLGAMVVEMKQKSMMK